MFAINLLKKAFSKLLPPSNSHQLRLQCLDDACAHFLHDILIPDWSINQYLRSIHGFLQFSSIYHQTQISAIITSFMVEEVYHLKIGPEREALCVEVKHIEETHFIVFERIVSDQQNKDPWKDLETKAQVDMSAQIVLDRYKDLLQVSACESTQSQAPSFPNEDSFVDSNSVDRVWTTDKRTVEQYKIGNGFKAKVTLLEFAILAAVVHEQGMVYSLLQHQRYWYCNLILSVLQKRSKSQSTLFLDSDDDQSDAIIDTEYEKWCGIRIVDIKKILVMFMEIKFESGILQAQETVGPFKPYYFLQCIDDPPQINKFNQTVALLYNLL